jgi:NodT family efflux transporter outer membrane factor (OMF) lipoprotein
MTTASSNRYRFAVVVSVALLAGCFGTGGIVPKSTLIDAALLDPGAAIRATQADAGWPQQSWWERWGDAQLNDLVQRAIAGNPDMHIAQTRVDLAESLARIVGAASEPQFAGNGSFGRTRFPLYSTPQPLGGHTTWNNSVSIDFSYDLDLWGKNRAALEGTLAGVQATAADARAVQLALETSIVRAYVQLALQYSLFDVQSSMLARQQHFYDIVQRRAKAGLSSPLEVSQARTPMLAARTQMQQTERLISLLRNQVAALAGESPAAGDKLQRPQLTLEVPVALPTSLPAELIGHRPDVVSQRWRIESTVEGIKVAKADFYPNINLVASVGLASAAFGNFFTFVNNNAMGYSFGPAFSLPIFDAGRRQGNYGIATAGYDLAVETYNKTVLSAFQSVADQVVSLQSLAQQQSQIEESLSSARQAYGFAEKGYRSGITDYLNVLNAENELLQQQQSLELTRAGRLDAWALLMQALGGGIEPEATSKENNSAKSTVDHAS